MAKTLSDFKLNKTNPFMPNALVKIGSALIDRNVKGSNQDEKAILKAVDGDGQILGNTVFMRNKVVDEEQFLKFYFDEFQKFFSLKPASIKVFGYIINLIKQRPNHDSINFYTEDCIKATNYTKMTIYRALAELCNAQIIARGGNEYEYFINPMVMFNGDRVSFATTYINKNYPQYETSRRHLKGTIDTMKMDKVLPSPDLPTMGDVFFNEDYADYDASQPLKKD